jgi:hypothetical protein
MIGSSTGSPDRVFAVPFAQPGAGIGTPVPASWITLELVVWDGVWPVQAFELCLLLATLASWPLASVTLAAWLAPVEL